VGHAGVIVNYMVNYSAAALDQTFRALSDPTRRAMLARLAAEPDASVAELARPFRMSKPAISKHLKVLERAGLVAEEEEPGARVQSDAELRDYVRARAWGHHAAGTCPIGPRERGGVLTSDFRVHGTRGLRVVDASVFPRIPGFFPVSAIYMVAEKAADDILAQAGR